MAIEQSVYTVFIREVTNIGTTHVSSHIAPDMEKAKEEALLEACSDWSGNYTPSDLVVVGVIAGSVDILEWNDFE